ncbi:MAG TPA: amidohydrolase family protein [Burkholderiales bacterium]|nr:amidohydrolase family protein [Burkholderiales bacterium]
MKIDVHSHLFDSRYFEAMWRDFELEKSTTAQGQTLMRRNGYTYMWYRDNFFDIDHRLRVMDKQGIDMRVLSLSSPNVYDWRGARQVEIARLMNDATAAIVRAHPDRFAGVGSLPLADVEASLAELERIVGELGLHGVMIGSNVAGVPVNDPRFEPVWARIDALRLPVFEHPMFSPNLQQEEFELPLRVGFIFDTTMAAARLIYSGVFERYPNFPYIMAHTGGALLMLLQRLDNGYRLFPDCRKHISKLPSEYARQLYYDTASFYPPALLMAHGIVGAERLLFGSDDPLIGDDTAVVDGLPLPAADKAKILGGNAARIFGIGRRA